MRQITARAVNHHTSAILKSISETGEGVAVTFRGEERWRILPSAGSVDVFERLIAEGRATRPTADLPLPSTPHRRSSGRDLDVVIAEMKADR